MFESQSVPPISRSSRIVVLTGAGISAESGIRTFRDEGGLWEQHRAEDIATPEAFDRDPEMVWRFYNERRRKAREVRPNAAHRALARLEEHLLPASFTLITQNVDNLHRLANSKNVLHMHGELSKVRCTQCSSVFETMELFDGVPHCDCGGMLRPDIVWFGEMPMFLEEIQNDLHMCDFFLAAGTSGQVYPAAGFLLTAKHAGATTVGVNLEEPANVGYFDFFFCGKAGDILPGLVDNWLETLSAKGI
jgi:NAD-dependent deacetylase